MKMRGGAQCQEPCEQLAVQGRCSRGTFLLAPQKPPSPQQALSPSPTPPFSMQCSPSPPLGTPLLYAYPHPCFSLTCFLLRTPSQSHRHSSHCTLLSQAASLWITLLGAAGARPRTTEVDRLVESADHHLQAGLCYILPPEELATHWVNASLLTIGLPHTPTQFPSTSKSQREPRPNECVPSTLEQVHRQASVHLLSRSRC